MNTGRKSIRGKNLPTRMRARRRPSGTYYYFDTGGTPRREIPLGSNYAQAIKKWDELTASTAAHTDLVTFRDAAKRYQREVLPKKGLRTQRDNLKELAKLYEFFDSPPAPLEIIQPIHIRQYLDWRVSGTVKRMRRKGWLVTGEEGQVRANREKALFSHIWNFARERGMTDKSNPCIGVRNFRETGRDTYVDDATYQAVWVQADEVVQNAMELAYLTGQRPADVLNMKWADVRDGAIWLQQGKTSKRLRIAVSGQLAVLLKRIEVRARKYKSAPTLSLICNKWGKALSPLALRLRFAKARMAAARKARGQNENDLAGAIRAFQFRDLRAKAGTDKEESAGMAAAKDQLGHADEKMTNRYVRNRKGKLVSPTR